MLQMARIMWDPDQGDCNLRGAANQGYKRTAILEVDACSPSSMKRMALSVVAQHSIVAAAHVQDVLESGRGSTPLPPLRYLLM